MTGVADPKSAARASQARSTVTNVAIALLIMVVLMAALAAVQYPSYAGSAGSGHIDSILQKLSTQEQLVSAALSDIKAQLLKQEQAFQAAFKALTGQPSPPAVNAAASSDIDPAFLQQVLQLSNYSSLSSARLLDVYSPNKDYTGMMRAMVQQQQLFCKAQLHQQPLPDVQKVSAQGLQIFVWASGDVVSGAIAGAQVWEMDLLQEIEWALSQYQAPAGSTNPSTAKPLFVDVGSNLGWFALLVAKRGSRVMAFEGMPPNIRMIRHSMCLNPDVMQRMVLFGTGLSNVTNECVVVSSSVNRGNGNVVCSSSLDQAVADLASKVYMKGDWSVRGVMPLRRMDSLINEEIQVMKIDVEGHETFMLMGADALLKAGKIKYLTTEVNYELMNAAQLRQYARFLYELGFDVSNKSFQGPFLTKEQVYNDATIIGTPNAAGNVFCKRRALPENTGKQ